MVVKKRNYLSSLLILVGIAFGLALGFHSISGKNQAIAQEGGPGSMAPPVETATVHTEPVQIWKSFSGRLEAVNSAEIRPQVSGTITEVLFEDGQEVSAGDTLFIIDPRPYEAALSQAKASLSAAKNRASFAYKEFKRAQELIKTDAISQRIFDERRNANNVARADVEAAEAMVEKAQIDYDYAHVTAPISGRVSIAELTVGNLVEAGANAPLLTTIVSRDGIYAEFEVDDQTYLNYVRNIARNRDAENQIPVRMTLSQDNKVYNGFIHSFDNKLDISSGTIRARALFENKDGALLPGMYANVELGSSVREAITIPARAIGTNQDKKFVYIVDEQNFTRYRQVMLGEEVADKRIVLDGLKIGETIVADGLIKIRPDMPVQPKSNMPKNAAGTGTNQDQEEAMAQGESQNHSEH